MYSATKFSTELKFLKYEIEEYARSFGLDFPTIIFEMLGYDELNQVAARGGFPSRYPHWRFGMEYNELSKSYKYGLHRIYEMVVNTDPCYAYLLKSNNVVDQKLVMAHVHGHADFFKNNLSFAFTNRKMMDEIANHGSMVRSFRDRHGAEEVERFLDKCLSLENLIDHHGQAIRRKREVNRSIIVLQEEEEETVVRLPSKPYMDQYINPSDFLDKQRKAIEENKKKQKKFPEDPEKDVLWFLLEYAPLKDWQREIIAIIREEAYYFAPQRGTKIMNEGWASFWHSRIMTEKCLKDSEVIDYADHHSGTMGTRPGAINPYKIGMELFRDIRERWDKGAFGSQYDQCEDMKKRATWDLGLGLGMEKVFEVRRVYNDIGFIDEFMTQDFAREHKLFTFNYDSSGNVYRISGRDFAEIKKTLLFRLTNLGSPRIRILDGNFQNKGEIYMEHCYEGVPLRADYAKETMANIYAIWTRPVHLGTFDGDRKILLTFDGSNHKSQYI